MKRMFAIILSACLAMPCVAFASEESKTWSINLANDQGKKYVSNDIPFQMTISDETAKVLLKEYYVIFALYNSGQFAYVLSDADGNGNKYEKDIRHDIIIENEDGETIETSGVQTAGSSVVVYTYTDEINDFMHDAETVYIRYSYELFEDQKEPIYQSFELMDLDELMTLYDEIVIESETE